MITHLVFFRLKPQADGRTACENSRLLVRKLNALKGTVPTLRALQTGCNLIEADDAYDVGLMTQFDDPEGLEAYRVHPAHQEVVDFVNAVTDARAAVDFEG